MASATRASWDAALFELAGMVKQVFATGHVYLAELNGAVREDDGTTRLDSSHGRRTAEDDFANGRGRFSGRQVRHTIIPYGLMSGGFVAETGTWNVPSQMQVNETHIKLVDTVVPFEITVDVERDSVNDPNVAAVAEHIRQARIALAKLENLAALGDGTGKVAEVTDASTDLTISVENANADVLVPGTIWDILTESNGADPGQGKRRKIASVSWTSDTVGVLTMDTAATASDGGSGNIVHAATEAVYIPGSYGLVAAGLQQALAASGTFQDVVKASNPWFQGTDGRNADTVVKPLTDQMLDKAVRIAQRWGVGDWDFGIGDKAAIDLYKQGKYSQVQYEPQVRTLKSGFSGVVYDGAAKPFPLISDIMHKKGSLTLIRKESIQMYGDSVGPAFLEDDGSMFRRFSRSLPKEADLLDRWQQGFVSVNDLVYLNNLDVAA